MHLKIETEAVEVFREQMSAQGSHVAESIDKVKGLEFDSATVNRHSSIIEMQIRLKKRRGEGGIDEIQVPRNGGFLYCPGHV